MLLSGVQAVGDIFAAPNGQLVFDAMKLADKGHGVLLLTLNYAGDQLAGKQAIKLAQKAGLNFRQVVTGEEIQYDPNGEDNKRGLCGTADCEHGNRYHQRTDRVLYRSGGGIHPDQDKEYHGSGNSAGRG